MNEFKRATLCWICQHARADRCTWFIDYTPVDGWDAIPTLLNVHDGYSIRQEPSFIVRSCPRFTPDAARSNVVKLNGATFEIDLTGEVLAAGLTGKRAHLQKKSISRRIPPERIERVMRAWMEQNGFSCVLKIISKKTGFFIDWKKMI